MSKKEYQSTLVALMSFRDNEEYDKERAFTVQQLSFVTPIDVLRWFNFKAYGVANPF